MQRYLIIIVTTGNLITFRSTLQPPIPGHGMGRLVRFNEPLPVKQVVQFVKDHLKLERVRLALADGSKEVKSVAICAGSGGSLLKNVPADLYLTGEMSHHEVLDAVHRGTHVVLCEHSNTERGFLPKWKEVLQKELGHQGIEISISAQDCDPLTIV